MKVIWSLTLSALHAGLGLRITTAIPFIPFQLHVKINNKVNINGTFAEITLPNGLFPNML
jgi:hypothetical protein